MTQGPEFPEQPQQPEGESAPPPYGQPAPPPPPAYGQPQQPQQPPPYAQPPYGQPPYAQQPGGYPPPPAGGMPYAGAPYGASAAAPYGVHPVTGIPYSDKTKLVAGLLQILIPIGIGRFYIGDTKTGVWQVVVTVLTCGIGALWPFIDGIVLLATDSVDAQGRPLRNS